MDIHHHDQDIHRLDIINILFYIYINRYMIDQLEVSRYGSSVTVLNAKDGFRIINTTENSLDVLNQFNRTYYYSCKSNNVTEMIDHT